MEKLKTNTPNNNMIYGLYNLNYSSKNLDINPFIYLNENKLYLDKRLSISIFLEFKEKINPDLTCTYIDNENTNCTCESKPKFSCNGSVPIKINKLEGIYAQQYICPRCGQTHIAKVDSREPNKTYEAKILKSFALIQSIEHNSLRSISKLMELLEQTHPSPQTIKNYINKESEKLKKLQENITFSGHYGYDEQHIKINGEKYYILAIIDVKTKLLLDFNVVPHLKKKVIKKFIYNATKKHPKHSLTTDNKKVYRNISKELGFKHNLCIFHLLKNFYYIFDKICKNENLEDEELRLIIDYGTEIQDMLYSNTYERAEKRFNQLLNEVDKFPEEFQKFLTKMKPVFREFMGHLRDKNLESTNNVMENFFGVNFPKKLKHLFKTALGVKDYLTIKAHNWNKKIMKKTNKIGKTLMNLITCNKICSENMK